MLCRLEPRLPIVVAHCAMHALFYLFLQCFVVICIKHVFTKLPRSALKRFNICYGLQLFFANSTKTVLKSQDAYSFVSTVGGKQHITCYHCQSITVYYAILLLLLENDSGSGTAPLLMLNVWPIRNRKSSDWWKLMPYHQLLNWIQFVWWTQYPSTVGGLCFIRFQIDGADQ